MVASRADLLTFRLLRFTGRENLHALGTFPFVAGSVRLLGIEIRVIVLPAGAVVFALGELRWRLGAILFPFGIFVLTLRVFTLAIAVPVAIGVFAFAFPGRITSVFAGQQSAAGASAEQPGAGSCDKLRRGFKSRSRSYGVCTGGKPRTSRGRSTEFQLSLTGKLA